MVARPIHIHSPSQIDFLDPNFPTHSMAWTHQIRSEMEETVALTKVTIAETRVLIKKADRLLARK
jgi:hypothetical protein